MSGVRAPLEGGGFIKAKDHLGHLVFFTEVHQVERRYDEKRKAEGDVLTLDWVCFMCHGGPNAELQERAMISAPHIVNKIHRDNPSLTLGYIVQLDAKPGFADGAIVLTAPNDVDIQRATAWWESHRPSAVRSPEGSNSGAGVDPWGASAASAPATSSGAGWGNLPPQASTAPTTGAWGAAVAPTSAPTNPAHNPVTGAPTGGLTPETVAQMPVQAVQALVAQGLLTREQANAAGHQV